MRNVGYNSGNSTLWCSKRVKAVDSVESDKVWFENIQSPMPQNVNLLYETTEENENDKYAKAVLQSQKKYDLIIVNGKDKNHCMPDAIKENGVIILDNSNRDIYKPAFQELKKTVF